MISRLPNISKAVDAIRRGELSPLDLVDFCLIRIEHYERLVRAWVSVDAEGARREAARLGTLARAGSVVGPLHGIPIGIKDIIDVAGWPTRAGSPWRLDHNAEKDAEIVERLRRAGAIILGKTVTTEFASFDPPPTRNPWNLEHTPGGSSSGSAAAVALEMCCAAIGSQTGGSIVRPASYCGVAGLKPTLYSVSLEGVVPLSPNLDHGGPLARSVADLGELYQVLQRVDSAPTNSWTPKLSWLKGFFWDRADKEVRQVTEQAIRLLGDMVENRDWQKMPASFSDVHACHRCLMAVDAAEYHRATFAAHRNEYGRHIAALIEEGLHASAIDYAHALRLQKQFSTEFQNALGTTILVTPSTPTPAPGLETTGDPAFNSPWSFAGVPTVTIPCGLASNGLPCGLQLIAAKLDEASLLAAAEECERRLGFVERPLPP